MRPGALALGMRFNVAAHLAHVIFEQPSGRVEGIAERNIDIFVRMVFRTGTPNVDVLPRDAEIDAHAIKLALMMMTMRRHDDNAATDDPVVKPFELGRLLANSGLERG